MQIVARASVMFLFMFLVLRIMGRKELSEMSAFDLVVLIVMGDLIQQAVTQQDNSITGAATAIATLVLWMLAMSYLSFKSKRVRALLEGQPVIVVRNGAVLNKMLAFERMTVDELEGAARQQGIADLRQVEVGVLEPDGQFSFIRFDEKRSPTPGKVEL